MQLSGGQVFMLSASIFVGIVGASFLFKYATDQKFREDFEASDRLKFARSIKPQLQSEEMMEAPAYQPLGTEDDNE